MVSRVKERFSLTCFGKEIFGNFPKEADGGGGGVKMAFMNARSLIPIKKRKIISNETPIHLRIICVSFFAAFKLATP